MKIAIAEAYNGLHNKYKDFLNQLGVDAFLFNIDGLNFFNIDKEKNPDAYFWYADQKEERYYEIYNKIYFIENILHKPVFPDMNMYFSQSDKVKQNQIFKSLNLPTVPTHIFTDKKQAEDYIQNTNYPFVLKDPYGYDGLHVFKIENKRQAKKYVNKIFGRGLKTGSSLCKDVFYAQDFIKIDRDLRIITIGNKIACAYWRVSEDWRHNIHHGAQIKTDNIPQKALDLCLEISQKRNFHWMSYDLFVLPNNDIKLVEWSCNFGTKGADQQGINVRKMQAEYMINYLKK